jgi:hypothetical protein
VSGALGMIGMGSTLRSRMRAKRCCSSSVELGVSSVLSVRIYPPTSTKVSEDLARSEVEDVYVNSTV